MFQNQNTQVSEDSVTESPIELSSRLWQAKNKTSPAIGFYSNVEDDN